MLGYCMKCRAKKTIDSLKYVKMNGRNAATGKCGVCGTKMFKFVKG